MSTKLDRDFVAADLAAIEALLGTLTPDDALTAFSLESRRDELREQLASMIATSVNPKLDAIAEWQKAAKAEIKRLRAELAEARRLAAINADEMAQLREALAEDEEEHERVIGYAKSVFPGAHSIYEVVDRLKVELAEERANLEFVANLRSAYFVRPMNGHGWRLIETDCGAMRVHSEDADLHACVAAARKAVKP